MHPSSGWTLLGLFGGSLLTWRFAPAERRRIRFSWALLLSGLALWLVTGWAAAPAWISDVVIAIEQVIGLHLAAILLFQVILSRFRLPRILSDVAIGAGYAAILLELLSRTGVNLTGLIATSAVATAVIGFGLQDLLGNLAGGLVLEIEQTIAEGDWIRTEQYFGQVRSVRMRHTALETPDGDTVLVPNSAIIRSPVTVLGRAHSDPGSPINHRKLVTFHLPYGQNPSAVIEAVDQALHASPLEGIAETPRPRCVIVDFHAQHVQYGALVWLLRPGLEYLDVSNVRARISFALSRSGLPLTPIPYVLNERPEPAPQPDIDGIERFTAIKRIDIFDCLNAEETRQLAGHMKKLSFAPGEVILRQGDPGDSAYIVKQGRVRILLSNGSGVSEQVACVAPGDFFGEMSLLTGEPRTATALALDQVDCYRLEKTDLDAVFATRPELAEEISALLTRRQIGLAATREKLTAETNKQVEMADGRDLLSRIRRYFAIA